MRGQAIENRYAVAPIGLHQRDVRLVPVVVVVGDVARVVVPHVARRVCVPVPDGLAFAVLMRRAFNLRRRRRHAPDEAFGELVGRLVHNG